MIWSDFLAALRLDLQDTGSTPRWSDDLLYIFTVDSVRDYSTWFPMRVDNVLLTKSGESYSLPSDFVSEIYVECPTDTFLKRRQEIPGYTYRDSEIPRFYTIESGALYLDSPTDNSVYLTYYAVHSYPAKIEADEQLNIEAGYDDDFEFTIPDRDLELIRLYVSAKVHEQMRAKTARLDRFDMGSGRRDDNPLSPEVKDLMKEYRQKLSERLGGNIIKLYRVGGR